MRIPENGESLCEQCGRLVNLQGLAAGLTVSICQETGSGESFHFLEGPDRSGEELGHFRLISKLGYGGMGSVYQAMDESLQRFVAVKVMRSPEEGGENSITEINRLLDEAVAQAKLNHPNVVTIYFVGRKEEEPFLAMELLPGPTMSALVKEGPLPYAEIIHYAQQVVAALAHASSQGLVHGDIKPGNLILAGDGIVKLSDFGLAKLKQQETNGEAISGTLSYMAPELAHGASPSDQTDMYSLGVTLFELTFGRRPFVLQGNTVREQLSSQELAQIEFPAKWSRSVPSEWLDVLRRLMARDPVDRYPDYLALHQDLRRVAPVGMTSAGLLNRGLAWMVDLAWPMLVMIPMILPGMLANRTAVGGVELPDFVLQFAARFQLFGLFSPLVPLVITYFEWRGWSTFGHYLFQLKLVDQHGLRLDRWRRLLRCLLRNAPLWIFSFTAVASTLGSPLLAALLAPIDDIIVLLNTIPVLGGRRLAMHDRIVSSRVVLDTKDS
jgi:eukaryotic-like serine/threonine-protein kinase